MLSSLALDAQLAPEIVTPVQFQVLWRQTSHTAPEKALCLAMIAQAAGDLNLFRHGKSARARRMYADARDWLTSEDRSHAFAFASICDVLGLSSVAVRETLLDRREKDLGLAA